MESQNIGNYLKSGINMNKLVCAMAKDMNIPICTREDKREYTSRVIYSALGQWCLKATSAVKYGGNAISKHRQTRIINNLLGHYEELFPCIIDYFSGDKDPAVTIRRLYEATGYIITDEENHNSIAQFGRTIKIGNMYLFFGEPFRHEMNGLGLFCNESISDSEIKSFLVRDSLNCEEYLSSCFDISDFEEYNEHEDDYQFFNPSLDKPVSSSWGNKVDGQFLIARSDSVHQFYLIQEIDGKTYYKVLSANEDNSDFTSYEYRRLYFALKYRYNHPVKAWISKIDDHYSRIRISSFLPNREYYLLLLLAWPMGNMFCKNEFLIKNEFIDLILEVLKNIGVKGERNG